VWSKIHGHRNGIAAGDYLDWVRDNKSFQGLWAESGFSANLSGTQEPEQIRGTSVRPGLLTGWGVTPMLGRDFLPEEAQPGRDHEVILMHKLWARRFGSRPDIIGSQIRINGEQYTVVGVLPPGQQDRMPNEMYAPLAFKPEQVNHDFHWLLVMGRLKPGISIRQAQADMDAVTKHIGEVYPQDKDWGASVEPLRNDFLPRERIASLWLLMGGVGFVLLIACANVANLLLARGTARQREVAVRASLGASRGRIFGQLLTESLALALAGGILGIGLGWGILRAVTAYMPPDTLPSEADVTLNLPVLLFAFGATVLAGVLAGCAPAFQAARLDLNDTLKQTGRALSGGGRHWLRRTLVVGEFTLALTLLAGAGLAIHSFMKITQLDLGVRTDHILTFWLPIPQEQMTDPNQIRNYYREMQARIGAVPGVLNVTVSTGLPIDGPGFGMPFSIAGRPFGNPSDRPSAGFQPMTPEYFDTFGIRVVQGRHFDEHDVEGGVRVAMVDENFAKRYLKGLDPLRQRVVVEQLVPGVQKLGTAVEWQIVGVFHTVQYGDRPDDWPVMYVPFAQSPWPSEELAVRTGGDPASMAKSIAAAVHTVDPELPLADVKTMDQMVTESRAGDQFGTVLYGSFAAVALLLAVLGIYGVIAFLVEQRTHEIGLRIALGAGRREVLRLVLGEGMALASGGLVLGLVGAWLVGRAMQSMLYGVTAFDYTAVGAVGVVLLASALVACLVPAQRAAGVDPMIALRAE